MTTYNSRNQVIHQLPKDGKRRPPMLSLRELADEMGVSAQRMACIFASHPDGRPEARLKTRSASGTPNTYFVAADLRAWWKRVAS